MFEVKMLTTTSDSTKSVSKTIIKKGGVTPVGVLNSVEFMTRDPNRIPDETLLVTGSTAVHRVFFYVADNKLEFPYIQDIVANTMLNNECGKDKIMIPETFVVDEYERTRISGVVSTIFDDNFKLSNMYNFGLTHLINDTMKDVVFDDINNVFRMYNISVVDVVLCAVIVSYFPKDKTYNARMTSTELYWNDNFGKSFSVVMLETIKMMENTLTRIPAPPADFTGFDMKPNIISIKGDLAEICDKSAKHNIQNLLQSNQIYAITNSYPLCKYIGVNMELNDEMKIATNRIDNDMRVTVNKISPFTIAFGREFTSKVLDMVAEEQLVQALISANYSAINMIKSDTLFMLWTAEMIAIRHFKTQTMDANANVDELFIHDGHDLPYIDTLACFKRRSDVDISKVAITDHLPVVDAYIRATKRLSLLIESGEYFRNTMNAALNSRKFHIVYDELIRCIAYSQYVIKTNTYNEIVDDVFKVFVAANDYALNLGGDK